MMSRTTQPPGGMFDCSSAPEMKHAAKSKRFQLFFAPLRHSANTSYNFGTFGNFLLP